jgi:polysaccharide pyruvyl transferase WcaK-like protein
MVAFAPDATFAITLQNKRKAENYLQSVGLEKKGFICAIPRLRYTPYFQLNGTAPTAEEKRRYEISMKFKEADAEKLRAVISRWVNETGLKVLLCPEMTYQVALSKEVLLDPLPENVKKNVVWRDSYWHPDEAGSIYANAISLVSYEMHSPIIAFHQGVPSVHLKQPTDTTKGQMWSDIGLGEWLFEIDTTSANQIGDAVMKIYREPAFAQAKMKAAAKFLKEKQQVSMSAVARLL